MQVTVLVEPMNGKGYRASGGEPFCISAEGATREEALKSFKDQVHARLTGGAELVAVEVDAQPHPWLEFAGMFKGDPLIEEWKKAMAEYRDQVERDDDYR